MVFQEFTYLSANGKTPIHAVEWLPDGEVLAHTDEDLTPVMAEIDLNEKQRMFWLSVGPAQGEIHGIYRYEKNPKSFGGN